MLLFYRTLSMYVYAPFPKHASQRSNGLSTCQTFDAAATIFNATILILICPFSISYNNVDQQKQEQNDG